MRSPRRTFLMTAFGAASGLALSRGALAAGVLLAETDPQAQALGYKADAVTVDKAKYPKYAAGQTCAGCQLYQGKGSSDSSGPCPLFAGKIVEAKGWCSAWVKKA